jgi:hypothetical protein
MYHWKYKNLTLLIISLAVAFGVSKFEPFHELLLSFGQLGYVGAFVAGFLFVSSFTVATGAVILLVLAERLSPFEIGIIAGLGAVIGDITIFRFVKDDLITEIKPLYNKFGGEHLTALVHTKYFSWSLPLIGAIIIASPLPDEIGVSLLGLSKMKTYRFLLLSFVLNAVGITTAIYASNFIKP